MIIKEGQLVKVIHERKGEFIGRSRMEFDTLTTQWFPITLVKQEAVVGLQNVWIEGDDIPCRSTLCDVEPYEGN